MLDDFDQKIADALVKLLELADELTYNRISRNCWFILSEIVNENADHLNRLRREKMENIRKIPVSLNESLLTLNSIYEQLYDVNLVIYCSSKRRTIIDIRYYLKTSLEEEYRNTIQDNPSMLHCKIALPPWRDIGDQTKFNINWQTQILLFKLRMGLARLKWKLKD